MQDKLKVVVFVCHGSFQAYLCHQLAQQFDVVGCVIESSSVKPTIWSRLIRYLNPVRLAQYLICKLVLPRQRQKANLVLAGEYDGYSSELQLSNAIKSLVVSDIHSPEVQQFVRELEPDVACVNGTRLIRAQLLALLSRLPKGVINLHTGLSPYSRGGNCILFELLEGRPEAIGGTIHFLDSGIDSGDILLTYRPMISRCDNYQTLNGRVFLEGTQHMVRVLKNLTQGDLTARKQNTDGKLFLKKTGYQYEPYLEIKANRCIDAGIIVDYLANKEMRDQQLPLVQITKAENKFTQVNGTPGI